MKKTIILSIAIAMTLAVSVTVFANISTSNTDYQHQEGVHVEINSQGKGACRHAGCKCTWYIRARGGAGKCICGHWNYIHN